MPKIGPELLTLIWIQNKLVFSLTERLHVVSPGLFDAEVGVDGGVPGRAREVLVFSVRDVLVGARVPVLLRQAEVDDVDEVTFLAQTPRNKYYWSFQCKQIHFTYE